MGPYPIELRQRVVDAYRHGMGSFTEVAEQFAVSHAFVCDLVAQYRQTGSVASGRHGGGHHKLGPKGDAKLRALVEADPDATLDELRARLLSSKHVILRLIFGTTFGFVDLAGYVIGAVVAVALHAAARERARSGRRRAQG